jgi:hypothetical protein
VAKPRLRPKPDRRTRQPHRKPFGGRRAIDHQTLGERLASSWRARMARTKRRLLPSFRRYSEHSMRSRGYT